RSTTRSRSAVTFSVRRAKDRSRFRFCSTRSLASNRARAERRTNSSSSSQGDCTRRSDKRLATFVERRSSIERVLSESFGDWKRRLVVLRTAPHGNRRDFVFRTARERIGAPAREDVGEHL